MSSYEPPAISDSSGERIQKVLARAGLGSRRACDLLVEAGSVTVNGRVAILGQRVDAAVDRVAVRGKQVFLNPELVVYALHKPRGYVCSARDQAQRPQAVDLVPSDPRVFTVGRLDIDTRGLILLTNDGELANSITHPSKGIDKEYVVTVDKPITEVMLRKFRSGVELDDSVTAPARASLVGSSVLRLTIHEGKNRQVRRMCQALGLRVLDLMRTRVGSVVIGRLAVGEYRAISGDELRMLESSID